MKEYTINELIDKNFDVTFLNSLHQIWNTTKSFQCMGIPKKYNLLLYLCGYSFTYTDKYGNIHKAESGDIVYTPAGSEYKVEISQTAADAYTIGINFLLFDDEKTPAIFGSDISVFHSSGDKTISMLFHQALTYDIVKPYIRNKILLMEILCSLASYSVKKIIPDRIILSLQYISEHIEENPTIAALSKLCGVSEVYFRKQFKHYMGLSPMQYRNRLRLSRARSYLEFGDISIQEISDTLGYSTVSHFIKEFRNHHGSSPLQYRKQFRDG